MAKDTLTTRLTDEMASTSLHRDGATEVGAGEVRLLEWLEEFDGPCTDARGPVLAARLGAELESIMGVDRGILTAALMAEYLERRRGS